MSDAGMKVCKAEEKQFNSDRAKFAKDAKSKVLRWKESGFSLKTALETISERGSVNEKFMSIFMRPIKMNWKSETP